MTTTTKKKTRAPKKDIYSRAGEQWHPRLTSLVGTKGKPGVLMRDECQLKKSPGKVTGPQYRLDVSPAMRMLFVIEAEIADKKIAAVTIDNATMRGWARLDRRYMVIARAALDQAGIIKTQKAGKTAYIYEVLNSQSDSLKVKKRKPNPDPLGLNELMTTYDKTGVAA